MANVDLNAITQHFRGKVGDLVFRQPRGRLQVLLRPKTSLKPPSDDQRAQRAAFKKALCNAKEAVADPVKRAVYERVAAVKNVSAFALAVGDCFHPPSVDDIDLRDFKGVAGNAIPIMASDDVEVKEVGVVVRKSDGTALEQGAATLTYGKWRYTLQTTIPPGTNLIIEVTATDWAGNKGMGNKMYP